MTRDRRPSRRYRLALAVIVTIGTTAFPLVSAAPAEAQAGIQLQASSYVAGATAGYAVMFVAPVGLSASDTVTLSEPAGQPSFSCATSSTCAVEDLTAGTDRWLPGSTTASGQITLDLSGLSPLADGNVANAGDLLQVLVTATNPVAAGNYDDFSVFTSAAGLVGTTSLVITSTASGVLPDVTVSDHDEKDTTTYTIDVPAPGPGFGQDGSISLTSTAVDFRTVTNITVSDSVAGWNDTVPLTQATLAEGSISVPVTGDQTMGSEDLTLVLVGVTNPPALPYSQWDAACDPSTTNCSALTLGTASDDFGTQAVEITTADPVAGLGPSTNKQGLAIYGPPGPPYMAATANSNGTDTVTANFCLQGGEAPNGLLIFSAPAYGDSLPSQVVGSHLVATLGPGTPSVEDGTPCITWSTTVPAGDQYDRFYDGELVSPLGLGPMNSGWAGSDTNEIPPVDTLSAAGPATVPQPSPGSDISYEVMASPGVGANGGAFYLGGSDTNNPTISYSGPSLNGQAPLWADFWWAGPWAGIGTPPVTLTPAPGSSTAWQCTSLYQATYVECDYDGDLNAQPFADPVAPGSVLPPPIMTITASGDVATIPIDVEFGGGAMATIQQVVTTAVTPAVPPATTSTSTSTTTTTTTAAASTTTTAAPTTTSGTSTTTTTVPPPTTTTTAPIATTTTRPAASAPALAVTLAVPPAAEPGATIGLTIRPQIASATLTAPPQLDTTVGAGEQFASAPTGQSWSCGLASTRDADCGWTGPLPIRAGTQLPVVQARVVIAPTASGPIEAHATLTARGAGPAHGQARTEVASHRRPPMTTRTTTMLVTTTTTVPVSTTTSTATMPSTTTTTTRPATTTTTTTVPTPTTSTTRPVTTTTPSPVPPTTVPPPAQPTPHHQLAYTGAPSVQLVLVGLGFLLAGVAIVLTTRRRRSTQ